MPFTGSWHPVAVAWGIVGMYLLLAIEITSLVRHRMSKRAWHAVHLLSYFLFATTTVHLLTAGTDVKALVASTAAVMLGVAAVFGSAALYVWRNDAGQPTVQRIPSPAGLDGEGPGAPWSGSMPAPSRDRQSVRTIE